MAISKELLQEIFSLEPAAYSQEWLRYIALGNRKPVRVQPFLEPSEPVNPEWEAAAEGSITGFTINFNTGERCWLRVVNGAPVKEPIK